MCDPVINCRQCSLTHSVCSLSCNVTLCPKSTVPFSLPPVTLPLNLQTALLHISNVVIAPSTQHTYSNVMQAQSPRIKEFEQSLSKQCCLNNILTMNMKIVKTIWNDTHVHLHGISLVKVEFFDLEHTRPSAALHKTEK